MKKISLSSIAFSTFTVIFILSSLPLINALGSGTTLVVRLYRHHLRHRLKQENFTITTMSLFCTRILLLVIHVCATMVNVGNVSCWRMNKGFVLQSRFGQFSSITSRFVFTCGILKKNDYGSVDF